MGSAAFPSREMKRLASFEARLEEDLSLKDIEEIKKKIVVETTDKTVLVAGRWFDLFDKFNNKEDGLIEREVSRLEHASDPLAKINILDSLITYLDPREVDERLDKIQWEASLITDPKVQMAVKEKLQHLKFAQAKPIVRDLEEFARRLSEIGREVLNGNSLAPMTKELSPFQIGEIQRAIQAGGV